MSTSRRTIVVVGHGMVGHRFVEAAIARGLAADHDIVVFGAEHRAAYDRVAMSSYVDGVSAEQLTLAQDDAYAGITRYLAETVTTIDREQRIVRTAGGRSVGYDVLVLATGSRPFVPPIAGHDAQGCFVYRTLDDIDLIRAAAGPASTGVVVGGGLLGLEAANALQCLGLTTHVVEMAPRLMPLQVDEGGGAVLRRHIEKLGVRIHTGSRTESVETGADGRVRRLVFADGAAIDTDLVVFSAGVRPVDDLARVSGLAVGERGGIVVDDACSTDDPAIYAIGECACIGGRVYGLVGPGYMMAEVLADHLAGGEGTFSTADTSTKLKLLGVDVASFGDAFAASPGALELVYADHVNGVYKKLVVTDDGGRLLGGILVGDASSYSLLRPMATGDHPLTVDPEQLLLPAGSQPVAVGPAALPPTATVCSCHNVSVGQIREAIAEGGATALGEIKAATCAGTGCGSCVPLVNALLADELTKAGREVDRSLCEHFTMTRQELFDVIRVRGIRSFTELIEQHGQGRGCAVCKPAVASILATQTGAHPLDGENAALQDTNDHVMANLQRDGSYSVVPRIPGGEVTPDGLMAIGRIAKDFDLYTKITGGQRIDMFGARIEQLPAIWRQLVDAGFESGHAYGKALRTVKSCVGSTWCRYGVQDSVALAIELELRYRGLRSPHKIKAGVSGCARECAEARGKDFGIIATEVGWNLYVGGNGGFTPRHAQLLVGDVDTATLIRLIDRYLMYYVRTADRLQRTAVWIESLDGGIDHLREVIVDDSLGLAADLEADMARHVAGYSDEWAAALDDPDKLRRFASFVNAPQTPDPGIAFVSERDQHRPARPAEKAVLLAGPRIPIGAP
ncbi:MAG: nitrite reductase (NAD(P)H) [Pseudonocardiales bacterium]|nr:MAG: nitrite reductase (NAD(P)H) [Pseudonocardiales bacterium]